MRIIANTINMFFTNFAVLSLLKIRKTYVFLLFLSLVL
jgi:hypothetical protein